MTEPQGDLVALIGIPAVFRPTASNHLINLALFIATVFSTLYVGATYAAAEGTFSLLSGWPFCLSIMLILGAHEMGHYFAARYHKVPVTLPYFIPLPLSLYRHDGRCNSNQRTGEGQARVAGCWRGRAVGRPLLRGPHFVLWIGYVGRITAARWKLTSLREIHCSTR